uniref:Uncharacterized protein n=1 Tax=Ciona intestinalis TaxID=7719 RepID=H2XQJ5_CIOIN
MVCGTLHIFTRIHCSAYISPQLGPIKVSASASRVTRINCAAEPPRSDATELLCAICFFHVTQHETALTPHANTCAFQ